MSLSLGVEASTVLVGSRRAGGAINKLSNARTSKVCMVCPIDTVPKELKSGRATQEFCMTFIQLLVYLHLEKGSFAA